MPYQQRFESNIKQKAYRKACECIYYGYSKEFWDDCGLNEEDRKEVWMQARLDVGV